MRGFKNILKLFPHEVDDVEPVLNLLQKQDPNCHEVFNKLQMLQLLYILSIKELGFILYFTIMDVSVMYDTI